MNESEGTVAPGRSSFREEQQFRQPWLVGLMVVVLALTVGIWAYAFWTQLVRGEPFGDEPMSDAALVAMGCGVTLLMIGVTALLWVARLETEVRDDGLHVRYRGLLVNRLIPYGEIESCEARAYRPLLEYGGWGVRWSFRHGKAYNVRGNRGVQLELTRGRKLLVGSQRADELAAAINARRPTP